MLFKSIKLAFLSVLITGCAHTIQINPAMDELYAVEASKKIDKTVGYYIPATDKEKEVITPGGGGDDVKYQPYKDSEAALNIALSKVFSHVYAVDSLSNADYLKSKNISYIFKPKITTNSSSDSALTWPPTSFTYELSCTAVNAEGKEVWAKTVKTEGKAEFSEFKSDFSLSARRASLSAYKELINEIQNSDAF